MPPADHFRAFPRRAVSCPASVRPEPKARPIAGKVINLSLEGACLLAEEFVPVGQSVALELSLPSRWDPVAVDATVVWVKELPKKAALGLRLAHESGAHLRTFLELLQGLPAAKPQ
jgi:hypothetical protein